MCKTFQKCNVESIIISSLNTITHNIVIIWLSKVASCLHRWINFSHFLLLSYSARVLNNTYRMRVWLQIQWSRVRSRSGPILSWRLIMKYFLRSFSFLPLNHSRRVVVSYKRKYVHEVLVNCLFKFAQDKMWLGELTVPP